MCRLGLGAALLLIASPALGQHTLDEALGPVTVAPPKAKRVSVSPPPAVPTKMDAKLMASDPNAMIRFIEADPSRLNVEAMEPALVLTLSQLLLRADRTFLAEQLMGKASKKWPERIDIRRGWSRVLISLGRPEAAQKQLETALKEESQDPIIRYLLARTYLSMEPRTPAISRAARVALEKTLALNPNYVDSDGVTASDIEQVIKQLKSGRAAPPGAP